MIGIGGFLRITSEIGVKSQQLNIWDAGRIPTTFLIPATIKIFFVFLSVVKINIIFTLRQIEAFFQHREKSKK